ncbi:MAG TPA: UbiD family decarboxylase [Candidatus Acidoferrales bacterium]|nr:UbiD family decarboxylase [Candidatus Acidoferrales bacterium]
MAVTEKRQVEGRGFTYRGLREWIDAVDRLGQLRRVHGANAEEEIGAATDVLQHREGKPAVIFDQVPGYDPGFRVLVNGLGAIDRIALTLGLPVGRDKLETSDAWRQRIKELKPLPPVEVKDGPIFENVRRAKDVDMTIFPAPRWHPLDGGRYIGTGSFDITLDPEDGWVNLGTYRVMVHDATRLGYYISPGKHGRLHRQKYFDRGERMPVAMVFGSDPLLFLASCTEIPYGVSEYAWVGAVRGQPQEVIKGPVTGLPLPADAEIVIEGFASPTESLPEGPFGEWTGYYASDMRPEPVVNVEALYYRDQAILLGEPPGQPPDEQSRYRAVLRSALLRDELEKVGIPDVVGAWQHEVGGSRLFTVVSIKQRYPGHSRQVMHVAAQCRAGAYAGRYTVVVDEDIDPSNLEEVMWALCTRSDPATSIDIIQRAWSTPLDPRIPPDRKAVKDFTNSRALIDATRPWEWKDKYAPINVPPREQREAALKRWGFLLDD